MAFAIATQVGGTVRDDWHLDSETAALEQRSFFHHITPAFDVVDADGCLVARLVDDITIRTDLDAERRSAGDWRRVVSDDPRFLRMLSSAIEPVGPADANHQVVAERFALELEHNDAATRLSDSSGASVAMIAGMPGERERVCEIISPPLTSELSGWVTNVTGAAAALEFVVPTEAAIHLHYDAAPFRSLDVFRRLVWAFTDTTEAVHQSFGTNPNCRRLGALPPALVETIDDLPDDTSWPDVVTTLSTIEGITKYADVNLTALLAAIPKEWKDTVEFRFLPGSIDAAEIHDLVARVDALVRHLVTPTGG